MITRSHEATPKATDAALARWEDEGGAAADPVRPFELPMSPSRAHRLRYTLRELATGGPRLDPGGLEALRLLLIEVRTSCGSRDIDLKADRALECYAQWLSSPPDDELDVRRQRELHDRMRALSWAGRARSQRQV